MFIFTFGLKFIQKICITFFLLVNSNTIKKLSQSKVVPEILVDLYG